MAIKVASYAGYKAEERPKAFILDEHEFIVHEILARWREEDQDCFRVISTEGSTYLLRYTRKDDVWDVQKLKDRKWETHHG
jgi:hypothetical protein